MTQEAFGACFGASKAAAAQWEAQNARGRTTPTLDKLQAMAATMGVPLEWLLSDSSPVDPPQTCASSEGETPPVHRVVQPLSLSPYDHPPLVRWEDLMSGQQERRPAVFRVALVDDAMAPTAPAGTLCTFEAGRVARVGDAVIVRDADGALHCRVYRQRVGGGFLAAPTHGAYSTLDSEAHGLAVVAVLTGISADWAQLTRAT